MHWPCILDSGFHPHTGLGTMETDMNAASIWQKCAIVLRTRLASVRTEVRRAATLSQQLGTLISYGKHGFHYAAPAVWNRLSVHTRQQQSIAAFKKQLKTVLFHRSYFKT
jgi:hypothetical protein